jgi:hypothetical protein
MVTVLMLSAFKLKYLIGPWEVLPHVKSVDNQADLLQ